MRKLSYVAAFFAVLGTMILVRLKWQRLRHACVSEKLKPPSSLQNIVSVQRPDWSVFGLRSR